MLKVGFSCSAEYYQENCQGPYEAVNIENPLYPGYLENNKQLTPLNIKNGHTTLVVDGAYIDLNPGTAEPKIKEITKEKVLASINYAKFNNADEIIFLSTFLPFINVAFYETGWIESSKVFWSEILERERDLKISLCNTFEYHPKYLIDIVKSVNQPNFGLAFDLGHYFAWGKITLVDWFLMIKLYLHTLYFHSNFGTADEHSSIQSGKFKEYEHDIHKILKDLAMDCKCYSIFLKYFNMTALNEDMEYLRSIIRTI